MLAEGSLNLRSREEIERSAAEDDAATARKMMAAREASLAGPRKPGRPAAHELRPETKVRSVRLPIPTWEKIDALAEAQGSRSNRFIEEAILTRFSSMQTSLFHVSLATAWEAIASIPLNDNFELRPTVVQFDRGLAA
jgi:predicted DNA-binding protein